jgi:hypothetical protein
VNAQVEAISPAVEPETGKVPFRTSIPNPDHRLKSGAIANVSLVLGKVQSARGTRTPEQRKSDLSLDERLNELERKLELILDDKNDRSPIAKILGRLSELQQKLDRALDLRKGK